MKCDSIGNIEWDKRIGGLDTEDEFGNIQQTMDGGYILAGTSYSNTGGDKSQNNLEEEQSWIIKIDSTGTIQWDRTLLTPQESNDEQGLILQHSNGCYFAGNNTQNPIGGDKTIQSWNWSKDYWIVNFCDNAMSISSIDSEFINIYPNPSNEVFYISGVNHFSWKLYNSIGNQVLKGNEKKIYLSSFSPGTYILLLESEFGISRKILIIR